MSYMSHTYREEDFGWGEMPDYSDTPMGLASSAYDSFCEQLRDEEREDYYRHGE